MTSCSKNCGSRKSDEIWRKHTVKDICGNQNVEFLTISLMEEHYCKNLKKKTEDWLDSLFKGQSNELLFTYFICGEANILKDPSDNKFCKNSHQYRMPSSTIIEARDTLSKLELEKISDFREILETVIDATKKDGNFEGIKNFGK